MWIVPQTVAFLQMDSQTVEDFEGFFSEQKKKKKNTQSTDLILYLLVRSSYFWSPSTAARL